MASHERPQAALPEDVLEETFARAPPAFQCLTVAQLSKAWWEWSSGCPQGMRRQCQEGGKPLWLLQRVCQTCALASG